MRPILAAVFVVSTVALPVAAQEATTSPFWKQGTQPASPVGAAPAQEQEPVEASSSNFPTRLAADVPPARAEATRLTMLARQATDAADKREEALLAKETPAVIEAEARVRQAAAQLAAARQEALADLEEDDDYVAAGLLADGIDRQIAELHQASKRDQAEIDRLAREALHYDTEQARRERERYAQAPAVAEAESALEQASNDLREARATLADAVSSDGELAQLRERAQEISTEAMAARVYADQVGRTADLALDFARRETFGDYDRYVRTPYGSYGYGSPFPYSFGYGYGIGVRYTFPTPTPVYQTSGGVVGTKYPARQPVITNVVRGQTDADGQPVITNVGR